VTLAAATGKASRRGETKGKAKPSLSAVGDAVVSSERPKLGPDIPKVITAWIPATGRVVYLTKDRNWSEDLADAEVLTGIEAN
jgi:hypothetical protein